MQGNKMHEQFQRNLERKEDVPKPGEPRIEARDRGHGPDRDDVRDSEFRVSRGGMNRESRDHNKHNHQTQSGHGPQEHGPAEEKH